MTAEDGTMLLTLVNPALESEEEICISFASETLAGGGKGVRSKNGELRLRIPAASIVAITVK